jgi:hypothetical protein
MVRTVDADVVRPRLHAKRVEKAMVVVRIAVAFVDRDVHFVGPFDEIEVLDRERHLTVARHPFGRQLFEPRVGAVTTDAVGVEQSDAEHEIVRRLPGADLHPNRQRFAAVEDEPGFPRFVEERDVDDFNLARTPAALGGRRRIRRVRRRGRVGLLLSLHGLRRRRGELRLLRPFDRREIRVDDALGIAARRRATGVEPERLVAETFDEAQ